MPSLIHLEIHEFLIVWKSVVCVLGMYVSSKTFYIAAGSSFPSIYVMTEAVTEAPIILVAFFAFLFHTANS